MSGQFYEENEFIYQWSGTHLPNSPNLVYLGVTLDRCLSYKAHIEKTRAKISTSNNILPKLTNTRWEEGGTSPGTIPSTCEETWLCPDRRVQAFYSYQIFSPIPQVSGQHIWYVYSCWRSLHHHIIIIGQVLHHLTDRCYRWPPYCCCYLWGCVICFEVRSKVVIVYKKIYNQISI